MARIGVFAFLAGIGVGAVVTLAAGPYLPPYETDEELDEDGYADAAVSVNLNVTAEDINEADGSSSSTLIDSLQGIVVPGTNADLVKVRVLGLERAKKVAMWGSKGKDGDAPTQFQRLEDLPTEHLSNILEYSKTVTDDEKRLIGSILEDRLAAADPTDDE